MKTRKENPPQPLPYVGILHGCITVFGIIIFLGLVGIWAVVVSR